MSLSFTQSKDEIIFALEDNGIGIEPRYIDRILLPFQKLENTIEAAGLGLALVKRIVEGYNGDLWITSKPNAYTAINFSIKL